MDALGSVVGTVLGGPIGGVVGSIASDVLGSVAKGGAGGAGNIFGSVLGPLTSAFGSLFGKANPLQQLSIPPLPLPFSPSNGISDLFNPSKMFDSLGSAVNKFTGGASVSGGGGLDAAMNKAEALMKSDNPDDQIAGMQQFMKVQQLIQTIITITQTRGKLAMEAVKSSSIS